jgi:two-component system KDP operon response regulator KdpE
MPEARPVVLICDDEPVLRELIRVTLGPDYQFSEAGSVADSIGAFRVDDPDVVVLDLMLIGGSGLEVLRAIRSDPSRGWVPVLVVSAWTDEANRTAVEDGGADGFLPKPFTPEELVARVEELVDASTARHRES